MSNKTQLQTNNNALNALITRVNTAKDTAASLPEAGGGSDGNNTVSVTISYVNAYGFDADGNRLVAYNGTYDFLGGIVMTYCQNNQPFATGTYIYNYIQNGETLYKFSADGGTISSSGGGAGN